MNEYDIATFQDLSGVELTEDQIKNYSFAEKRAVRFLENELGWTFSYETQFFEKGRTKNTCICPKTLNRLDGSTLLPPEEVKGKVKLFSYHKSLSKIPIDPATAIYSLKLVVPLLGDSQEYITVKKLENIMPGASSHYSNFIRYVERCDTWPSTLCGCDCENCVLLAVDADWVQKFPEQMKELLTELILYFMRHPYTLETSATIKSESVDGHSVSYDKPESLETITTTPYYQSLIKKYIGPYSPYYTKVRIS